MPAPARGAASIETISCRRESHFSEPSFQMPSIVPWRGLPADHGWGDTVYSSTAKSWLRGTVQFASALSCVVLLPIAEGTKDWPGVCIRIPPQVILRPEIRQSAISPVLVAGYF